VLPLDIHEEEKEEARKKLVACQFIARLPQTPRATQLFSFFWPSAHDALHCRMSLSAIVTLDHETSTLWAESSLLRCQNELIPSWKWMRLWNAVAMEKRDGLGLKISCSGQGNHTHTHSHTQTLSPYLILVQVCTLSRNGAEVDIFSFIYLETVWYLSEWSH